MKQIHTILITLLLLICSTIANAQSNDLPSIIKKDNGNGYTFLVDGKPFIVLGAQLWNSSSWPYILDKTWPQLRELHCNTLEAPVYWQNLEQEQGKFNFKELDSLIAGARKEGMRLILLWFGSYKNGSSSYAPEWVLSHPEKYPRMKNGGGEEMMILSALSPANIEADKKAFTAFMQHLKQADGQQHTVIMVQVENESGSLGTDRDYSAQADSAFNKPVPAKLLQQLGKTTGTWETVFGVAAAESFNAYHIAGYVNQVAAAGKKVYALPMYTNAWLSEHAFHRPGDFPSGGPTSNMFEIWKATAPELVLLAPDIYQGNYIAVTEICSKYNRTGNPFFVPETGKGSDYARYHLYMLGNYNALGVAVYGIDPFHADPNDQRTKDRLDDKFSQIADNYRLLRGALDKIAELQGSGNLKAIGEEYNTREQLVNMDGYDILFYFGYPGYVKDRPLSGRALVAQLGDDEFLIMGFDTKFQFRPTYGSGYQTAEIISMEEGFYENGKWVRKRFWNGDEAYHSTLTPEGVILKVKLRKTKKANTSAVKANFE